MGVKEHTREDALLWCKIISSNLQQHSQNFPPCTKKGTTATLWHVGACRLNAIHHSIDFCCWNGWMVVKRSTTMGNPIGSNETESLTSVCCLYWQKGLSYGRWLTSDTLWAEVHSYLRGNNANKGMALTSCCQISCNLWLNGISVTWTGSWRIFCKTKLTQKIVNGTYFRFAWITLKSG